MTDKPSPTWHRDSHDGAGGPDAAAPGAWPRWVRYPLIAVVVGVAVYGIVSVIVSGGTAASEAGARTSLSVAIAKVTAGVLIVLGVWWRQRRRHPAETTASSSEIASSRLPGEDSDAELMSRRLAALDGSVREAYREAHALLADLDRGRAGGPSGVETHEALRPWKERLREALSSGDTANAVLWELHGVLAGMTDDPDLDEQWRSRARSLSADVEALLGIRS